MRFVSGYSEEVRSQGQEGESKFDLLAPTATTSHTHTGTGLSPLVPRCSGAHTVHLMEHGLLGTKVS